MVGVIIAPLVASSASVWSHLKRPFSKTFKVANPLILFRMSVCPQARYTVGSKGVADPRQHCYIRILGNRHTAAIDFNGYRRAYCAFMLRSRRQRYRQLCPSVWNKRYPVYIRLLCKPCTRRFPQLSLPVKICVLADSFLRAEGLDALTCPYSLLHNLRPMCLPVFCHYLP